MAMTFTAWLNGISAAYNIDVNLISTSEANVRNITGGAEVPSYIASFNPPSFLSTDPTIVSLNIAKSEIIP